MKTLSLMEAPTTLGTLGEQLGRDVIEGINRAIDLADPGEVRGVSVEEIQAEIKNLAKKFCYNTRVASKYRNDKGKYIAFLKLLSRIASHDQVGNAAAPTPPEAHTFHLTVEELSSESGLTAFEVDKFLRWSDKGLHILKCTIPKDKKLRDREITIDSLAVSDLEYLLDPSKRIGLWDLPVEVAVNKFKFKSLSAFSLNIAIGCFFGCLFCYVPSVSTLKLGWRLIRFGVLDADNEWGTYCLIRKWDEDHFRQSLRKMLAIPASKLAPDGHRAIMLCTDTDAYMPVFHPDPVMRKKLHEYLRGMVRRCLEILLEPEFDQLKLRVQTRGLEVEQDFDLMRKFGDRLLFGMSIPTLNNTLAKIYEPRAPAPTQRLEVIRRAADMGIHCYVAMAPTFPECDEADIRRSFSAFAQLPLYTVFHEAINARANNVTRIQDEARRRNLETKAGIIRSKATRTSYAIDQMKLVERIATELGIGDKLHLWPDPELLVEAVIAAQQNPEQFRDWLRRYHGRISEWPGEAGPRDYNPYPSK